MQSSTQWQELTESASIAVQALGQIPCWLRRPAFSDAPCRSRCNPRLWRRLATTGGGGIGTLEEFVEQMTWWQLGRHQESMLLASSAGFCDPLIQLLDQMRRENH